MSEQEVIARVKGHLQGRFNKTETITKSDRIKCITMIMDFLPHLSKKQAQEFFNENILKGITFDSTDISGIKYVQGDCGTWVYLTTLNTKLHIDADNIISFAQELLKVGQAYKVLGVS